MSRPLNMVCSACGSGEVVKDAWAEWCIETQEWVLKQTFDQAFCEACESECAIDEVVLTDEKFEEIAEEFAVRKIHNG